MLTLWVWLHVVGREFGRGTEVVDITEPPSKAPFDRDPKKQQSFSIYSAGVSQHHLLIKIWDLITFSSCF